MCYRHLRSANISIVPVHGSCNAVGMNQSPQRLMKENGSMSPWVRLWMDFRERIVLHGGLL